MVIVTRVRDWHDCRLLRPRPNYLAHVRRLSIIDVVLSVCGTMVDVQLIVSRASNFHCLSVCNRFYSGLNICTCDKSVWSNMTAEEQRLSGQRSEYAFVTIMNKFKKKDVYNYMPRFDDASVLGSDGSKNVRTSGEPKEFINLVQNQSFRVM